MHADVQSQRRVSVAEVVRADRGPAAVTWRRNARENASGWTGSPSFVGEHVVDRAAPRRADRQALFVLPATMLKEHGDRPLVEEDLATTTHVFGGPVTNPVPTVVSVFDTSNAPPSKSRPLQRRPALSAGLVVRRVRCLAFDQLSDGVLVRQIRRETSIPARSDEPCAGIVQVFAWRHAASAVRAIGELRSCLLGSVSGPSRDRFQPAVSARGEGDEAGNSPSSARRSSIIDAR